MTDTTDYPAGYGTFAGVPASDATRRAYAALMVKAALRPRVSEATMDRYRVRWNLCQLEDAGIVRHWNRENLRRSFTAQWQRSTSSVRPRAPRVYPWRLWAHLAPYGHLSKRRTPCLT
jgi:hypothetical protein